MRAFVEKPGPGEAISDTVNTGIYILEPDIFAHIPEGKPCDFGGELFPRLVGEGKAVYGCVLEGYWCDIGDVGAYLRAHADLLEGKLKLETPAGVQRGALVDGDAHVEQPCYIGAGARVERGAVVGKYAVIGAGAVVEARASVKRSVLWPGARVGREAQARGCVLGGHALLDAQAQAFEGCALGTGAQGRHVRSFCRRQGLAVQGRAGGRTAGEQPRLGRGRGAGALPATACRFPTRHRPRARHRRWPPACGPANFCWRGRARRYRWRCSTPARRG